MSLCVFVCVVEINDIAPRFLASQLLHISTLDFQESQYAQSK